MLSALMTMGMRNMYAKFPIHSVADVKGKKIRVQATTTEDAMFPAYGAQTVHMPFGEVYTSLQTGVVQIAENGVNVYMANKHYEVAPVLTMTEHEANNNCIWVSDKTWNSLNEEQQGWVMAAAAEVAKSEPATGAQARSGFRREAREDGRHHQRKVDKSGFMKDAKPHPGRDRQEARPACGQAAGTRARCEIADFAVIAGGGVASAAALPSAALAAAFGLIA